MNTIYSFEELLDHVRKEAIPVYTDSRCVTESSVFIAQQGTKEDGRAFIYSAITKGAKYIVIEGSYALPNSSVVLFCVDDIRVAEARLAEARYAPKDYNPLTIGITGTNGKTTSSYLMEHLLINMGRRVGVIGTVNYHFPGHVLPSTLTTPSCLHIYELFSKMREENVDAILMEVSSHSLAQRRTEGISFDGVIFTNVTQDHLDYHHTMEEYFQAKLLLFSRNPHAAMAINIDDEYGKRIYANYPHAVGFTLREDSFSSSILCGSVVELSTKGMLLSLSYAGEKWTLSSALVGKHNAYNLLGVIALALALGFTSTQTQSLSTCVGVIGRLERIEDSCVFVDYAHTPDALSNVLATLKDAGFTKILTVFGCGGERDSEKRPLMATAVEAFSDIIIVTSDNPRNENPDIIIEDIMRGFQDTKSVHIELDREKAITLALSLYEEGMAILIAGKGHEEYQIIGETKYPFSDQKIVKALLKENG
ncbi:MAG: UDP-N-acetylmuramoyl-L-alanyl-D-glutamate--2,6-diaminopimelate ligase [Desulfovibrionaceae bacterium]